jgi:hypothetical protein
MKTNNINQEQELKETRRSSIRDLFYKILPGNSPIKESEIVSDMSVGANEPTVNDEALTKLTEFVQNKQKVTPDPFKSALSTSNFSPVFETKRQKVLAYKTMYMYPDINKSVNIVTNTAVSADEAGNIMKLIFKNEDIPEAVQSQMAGIFDYTIYDIFDIENTVQSTFKKFLIEGEIFIELISNTEGDNIISHHVLPSYSTIPIFGEGTNSIIGYVQHPDIIINGTIVNEDEDEVSDYQGKDFETNDDNGVSGVKYMKYMDGVYGKDQGKEEHVEFFENQVAYANYGNYGSSVYDVSGYLEPVRKTYNMMNTIDDSLAVYRFVRAPETRLWNVYTKGLPTAKADEYLDNVINEFRKDYSYDASSGSFSQTGVFNSIIDDYFFTVGDDGNKTTVDTLSGAMNLDNLADVQMHKERLMSGLQIPRGRWDKEVMKEWGTRNETTTGEEQQFSLLIEQVRRNFSAIYKSTFITMCRLNGIDEKYLHKRLFSIEFGDTNTWKFWQDMEVFKTKAETYTGLADVIRSEDNPTGHLAPKYAFKKVFRLSAEEEELNEQLLQEYEDEKAGKDKNQAAKDWKPSPNEDFKMADLFDDNKVYKFGQKYIFGGALPTDEEVNDDFDELDDVSDDVDVFEDDEDITDVEYQFGQKYIFGQDIDEDIPEVEETSDWDGGFDDEVDVTYSPEYTRPSYDFDQKYLFGQDEKQLKAPERKYDFNKHKYLFGSEE